MERQDAIYWITNLIGRYGKEYDEALEMAESAIRQQPELIEDAVSRQQVIDTIMGEPSETYYPCYFAEMIRRLPAAAHQKIIRCGDCKHWKNEHLCESLSRFGSFETKADFYCGYAERKINERTGG